MIPSHARDSLSPTESGSYFRLNLAAVANLIRIKVVNFFLEHEKLLLKLFQRKILRVGGSSRYLGYLQMNKLLDRVNFDLEAKNPFSNLEVGVKVCFALQPLFRV